MTTARSRSKERQLERLFFYAEMGKNAELRAAIKKGADLEARNPQGLTPLILAVGQGRISTVPIFLNAGAKVDAPSTKGRTALMFAVQRGFYDIAVMLIEAGADIAKADNEGKNVRQYASSNEDMVRLIDSIKVSKQLQVAHRKDGVEEIISDLENDLRKGD